MRPLATTVATLGPEAAKLAAVLDAVAHVAPHGAVATHLIDPDGNIVVLDPRKREAPGSDADQGSESELGDAAR